MRAVKFRGKRLNNGEWVYGYYVCQYGANSIYLPDGADGIFDAYHVIPETVGQFTGLTDKNGTEIFEGDTIKGGIRLMSVIFKQAACQFWLVWEDDAYEGKKISRYEPLTANYGDDCCFSNDGLEVVGNIHDN
jgi:uncharacterized phage protein (TIGR01671 family)